MKFKSKIRMVANEDKKSLLMLELDTYQAKYLDELKDEELSVEIKKYRSNRSLRQNALLWKLIHEIDRVENGRNSEEGEMSIYCNLIKMAKVKTVFLETVEEAKSMLEDTFRVVKERERRESKKGTTTVLYECYIGTSKFDTKEMTDFIEITLDYASKIGVNLIGYEELRND